MWIGIVIGILAAVYFLPMLGKLEKRTQATSLETGVVTKAVVWAVFGAALVGSFGFLLFIAAAFRVAFAR